MRNIKYILIVCTALIGGFVNAQSQRELGQLMRNRGEYYFTLNVDDLSQIQDISRLCSVDGTDGRTVVAYANQQEYDQLIALGYQPNLQTPPSLREEAEMWEGGDRATYEWDSYLTYGQYVSMMEGFPSSVTNGAICTLLDLGTLSTSNHRRILGVRLNNGQPDGKPKFLYSSTMHGDEVTGMILMLRLINEFCTSSETRILNILNNVDLFIFPDTNPDGTYYGGNSSVSGARRYNGNGIDLNRHFPDFDDGAHPDGASYYQDEAQWMMDLAQQYLFTMGANYHGGAEVVNYPWDTYQPLHPDDDWWQYVSREYAQLCQSVNSSYMCSKINNHANPSGITNGYAWYTITGSRQDYMNYYGQCREVTIECSKDKTPNASQLPNFWNYNHNAMLTYIEECLNGVHGFVYDAETGEPIEGVAVTVQNHDAFGSSVSTHTIGDFHRPIKAGTYTFEFKKNGYCPETVEVTIADGQRVELTVNLTSGCAIPMDCYAQVMPSAEGPYVMGYLNGSNFAMPTHHNSSTSITVSIEVAPTENGFSVAQGAISDEYMLSSTGTFGQYYISYNGRYLTRSTSGIGDMKAITWSASQGNSSKWTIDENGITQTSSSVWGGSTTYYLYYNNGSFYTSTTYTDNITFYSQCDCPVIQTINFVQGWNWWTPAVESETLLGDLESALGTNGVSIVSNEDAFVYNYGNGWMGDIEALEPGKMYMIQTNVSCTLTLTGQAPNPADYAIALIQGYNWIGFVGTQSMALATALSGLEPTDGDIIMDSDHFSTYYTGIGWMGDLTTLEPGIGYMYKSNATETKTFYYPSGN